MTKEKVKEIAKVLEGLTLKELDIVCQRLAKVNCDCKLREAKSIEDYLEIHRYYPPYVNSTTECCGGEK